jgi:anoctamin-10
LTLKTFALTSIVAYLGLAMSAFVYVPFGVEVMQYVQSWLFEPHRSPFLMNTAGSVHVGANATAASAGAGMWEASSSSAVLKLNPRRLRDQMFAYTVTNQVVNTFVEVGLPFVLRFVFSTKGHGGSGKKKRVVFEDEVGNGNGVDVNAKKEEREFLEGVRREVALPEYELFGDYNEMVTQFGYVALWSTIWPLAPGAFLLSSDYDHIVLTPSTSNGTGEQLPRAPFRRVQDHGAQPPSNPNTD